MRTELHHHHHHHQVPTCGIKHQVLHRTHLKKKRLYLDSYQKYYHIVYKICQLALITLLHSVQQLHNFGKTPGHSLSFKAATTPHPSTCPRDILTILTGKKNNAEHLYLTIQNKTYILHPLSISCGIFATNPILSNIYIPKGLHRYVYIFLLFYHLVYQLYLIDFSSEPPPCLLFCNK